MGKHSADRCERCGATAGTGQRFVFVSWAVDFKSKKKGMLLCPTCEAKEVKNHHGA